MQDVRKLFCICVTVACLGLGAVAFAQGQCPANFCNAPITNTCDAGGFLVTQTGFQPANNANSGIASYTYRVCSPAAGTCVSTVRDGQSCLDNEFCRRQGQNTDPNAFCTRQCAVDVFRELSHFDMGLPLLGGLSCLAEGTQLSGSCSRGSFTVGQDGSCGNAFVAKCDNPNLAPGQCLEMTINIPGEENAPGLGAAFMVSKESQDCNTSCIAGPSCQPCRQIPNGEECLTRTLGFWGTHPHLIQSADERSLDLLPITVCGDMLTTTDANSCSTSEALCTSARDRSNNPTYLSMAAHLAAAKLNLAATAAVSEGSCSSWRYRGMDIQQWINHCEINFCAASKQAISASGCIEALDAFNNSQDVGFAQTPFPFNRPGPALVSECQLARGNGTWVGNGNCP